MKLLNATDDFLSRSLGTLRGFFDRLEYIAELRQPDGSYAHWGLSREYGQSAAQLAIKDAHQFNFRLTLRQPCATLCDEVQISAKDRNTDLQSYFAELSEQSERMITPAAGMAQSKHFHFILLVQKNLAKFREQTTHQAA